ncbi:MAG: ubiquinol-cytochrome c reductase iron-sulfur subunit [Actinomycetota bacterium]
MSRTRKSAEQRFGVGVVNASFLASFAASIGLVVVYLAGGQPQIEGLLLLVVLGGIGVGLVTWGHRLLPQGPYVQAREPLTSTQVQRRAVAESFERRGQAMGRRTFMGKLLALALGALGVVAVFPIRSLGPSPGRSLFRTKWRRGLRVVTSDGFPVSGTDLEVGSVLTVWPEGFVDEADSQVVLIRMNPSGFRPLPGRETWSPDGYLAYSKICTHAGCPVGLYEARTQRLFCPCHQSVFDAVDGAKPLAGPATRPLPQLPLEIDPMGVLRARGDFSDPVGPAFWNLDEP